MTSDQNVLRPFVRPQGIALMAAANDPGTMTIDRALALRHWGFGGHLAVIDPTRQAPEGPTIEVVEQFSIAAERCDVALLTMPADDVLPALRACAEAGIMNAVALAPGFEALPGERRRTDLDAFLASATDFRLVGPNCAGVMSAASGAILSTSVIPSRDPVTVGGAGLIMQSGGIGSGVLQALVKRRAGFAHWFTTGDEVDLGALQIAVAMLADPACTAVGMFLEGFSDPEYLPELGVAIERSGKPVVALHAGSSVAGRATAFGHTGRIVGDTALTHAAAEQAGIRLVDTIEELCDAMTVLSVMRTRIVRGEARVGVVAPAGGVGVVAADEIGLTDNLALAELTPQATDAIEADVRSPFPVGNPYDLPSLGDEEVFSRAIRAMGEHGGCDVVLAVATTLAHDHDRLAADDYAGIPPIVFAHMSPDERFTPDQASVMRASGIVSVPSLQNAIRAIAIWAGRGHRPAQPPPASGHRRLGLVRSRDLLGSALDSWMAPVSIVLSEADAIATARRVGGPVALKAEGTQIEHRTELGAVRTNLKTPEEVSAAFEAVSAVCAQHGDEVAVQAMARDGVEILVSVVRDPELGAVAILSIGGILAELGGATTVLTAGRAWSSVIRGTPVGRLLDGFRGSRPADTRGLLELVEDLLSAVRADDRIMGIECNPVVVHPLSRPSDTSPVTVIDLLVSVADTDVEK